MTEDTLVHRIAGWAAKTPDKPATHVRAGSSYQTNSWSQHWTEIRRFGRALIALGLEPGERVTIVSGNRPEFVQAQFGIQAAQGIAAPIYPTSTQAQTGYIVGHCGASIAFCDSAAQLDKHLAAERDGECRPLRQLIVFEPVAHEDPRVLALPQFLEHAERTPESALDQRLNALKSDDTCSLIFTSGTTGMPKGVMLNHAGQLTSIGAVLDLFSVFRREPYRVVSYLPLSHQTEQLVTNVGAILTGGEVYFCPDINQVRDYLIEARPTLFMGVPRVWEKFEAALRGRLAQATGVRAALANWALSTELRGFERDIAEGRYHASPARSVARKLVIDTIKAQLGLDKLLAAFTGSAPMPQATMRFFGALGIPIHEGYGLSETSGLATIHRHNRPKPGTVGQPLPCTRVRIAEDGEIELAGPNVTRGYFNLPDETHALFTDDGFMRTGDLGCLDADGQLQLTGRKKELLITAGGKNVAPAEIEQLIGAIEGVGQVVVVGDRQPNLCALITLEPATAERLAQRAGVATGPIAQLARAPELTRYLQSEVERTCNAKLARYQSIKKIAVLPDEFSVEGGELTPSMKLRRNEIAAKYAAVIEGFYRDKNLAARAAL